MTENRISTEGDELRKAADPDSSQLERLRRKRQTVVDQNTRRKVLPVPGYDDELGIRFKVVEWKRLKDIGKRAETEPEAYRELMAQIDTMLAATECIVVMKADGEWHPLMGETIGFDQRLVELLELRDRTGAPPKSARDTMRALFNGNDLAISAMHNDLMVWMPKAEQEAEGVMAGN